MCFRFLVKPIFHLANLFARTDKKVGTLPTCSRRIFSRANFNQSRCSIPAFASRRAKKVAKRKIGLRPEIYCKETETSIKTLKSLNARKRPVETFLPVYENNLFKQIVRSTKKLCSILFPFLDSLR